MASKLKRVFTGTVKGCDLEYDEPKKLKQYLCNDISGGVEIVITKPRNQRSIDQNRYYWGVVVKMIAEERGEDRDSVHRFLKTKFLRIVAEFDGNEFDYVRSTKSLSTTEWEEYMRKCRQWATMELGLFIPKPNEWRI